MQITAQELAVLLKGEVDGNPTNKVSRLAKIEEADQDSLSFIANPKYEHFAEESHAGILVVRSDFPIENKNGTTYIRVADPYASFAILLEKFNTATEDKKGIEKYAYVSPTSVIGDDVYIGAFAYIGSNVTLGKNVKIYPNSFIGDNTTIDDNAIIYSGVHIYHSCCIGKRTIVHSGVVIGSDGFGFAPNKEGGFDKVPQTGNVVIGNDVEIGANTVIDRATLGSTEIKAGAKIDNLVQIAHNVQIGHSTVVASQAGISGSTKVGDGVMIGGQAGFVGHITVADGAKINAQSGVSKSIEEKGKAMSGSPAEPFRQHYKNQALIRKLPEILQRLNDLEQQLKNK